jgi:hypothetical protein
MRFARPLLQCSCADGARRNPTPPPARTRGAGMPLGRLLG